MFPLEAGSIMYRYGLEVGEWKLCMIFIAISM